MAVVALQLVRFHFAPTATLGRLAIDGAPFGYVVEDVDRGLDSSMSAEQIAKLKVAAATAIPATNDSGPYIVIRTDSKRFGRVMPLLYPVPGFRGIRIHAGNTSENTEGCILPGLRVDLPNLRVLDSGKAAAWLDEKCIAPAIGRGDSVSFKITRDIAAWAARPKL